MRGGRDRVERATLSLLTTNRVTQQWHVGGVEVASQSPTSITFTNVLTTNAIAATVASSAPAPGARHRRQ